MHQSPGKANSCTRVCGGSAGEFNHSVICKGHHCIGLVTLLILFVPLTVNTIFVGKQNSTRHKHWEVFTRFNQQCP